jgi:hypothetical protein
MDTISDIIGGLFVGFIIGYVVGFYANYFYEMRLEKKAIENNKIRRIKERFDCYMKYGNKDETCWGIYGEDKCIGCPHNIYTGKKDIKW